MRIATIALAGLLPVLAATPASAEAPRSVVALLGPSLGHLLAQSDLCGWNLQPKIETTYKASFHKIGLTAAQQTAVWDQAKLRRQGMLSAPDDAKARMKAEMCSPAIRTQIDHDLAN
ncbi:MAG: hypothetical protein WDN25_28990 [Acetobacteraceae bacterium]